MRSSPSSALRRSVIFAALAVALVPPFAARAQVTTGTVRGYVRDANGAAVATAQVVARETAMGITRTATSNTDGFYSLTGLRPGQYAVDVRRLGFSPQTQSVTVQIGQTLDVNFTLAAAATQLSAVQVTAAPTVETKTSEVATNVTPAQITQLPSPSRNFLDLAILAPGVRVTPDRIDATGKTFAAGAQPAEQVNVFIDGTSYKNDIVNGGIAGQDASRGNPFPRNAVQEFRVATSNFKAEYQKASSAIITAVTKSGTNDWQGNAFLTFQNQNYVGLDTFSLRNKFVCDSLARAGAPPNANGQPCFQKPEYSRYLMGLSAGGPIVRDKLFFFGSYEGNIQDRTGVTRLNGAPSSWPSTIAGVNGNANTSPFRSNLLFGKLTWNRSEKQLLEFSTDARLETDKRDFGGQFACQCWDYSTGDSFRSNVVTGRAKHTYYGTAGTNEALLSYQWYQWRNVAFDFNTPAQDYAGIGRIGGHDAQQDLTQNRLSLRDDYTISTRHMFGAHVPKVGANIDFDRYDMNKQLNENPTFFFDPSNNFQFPVRASIGFGNPVIATNNTQIGLYAQDDWSPTDRLTLNLGVRWDYESNMFNRNYVTPTAVRDSITAYASQLFVPIDPNRYFTNGSQRKGFYGAIQPRVGLSYALDRDARTTVFGGWGLYYDRLQYNATLDESYRRQHPNYNFFFSANGGNGTIAWNPQYFSRQGLINAINNGQAPPQEVFLIPNDLKPPHSNQWSAGLRHDFGTWNTSITYNNVRSFNGFTFEWGNVTFVPGQNRNCCFSHNVPAYQNVLVGNNSVRTWYDGVQLALDRPYRRSLRNWGWGAGISWEIAKAEAEGGDLFSFPQLSWNPRHPVASDERHHIVANWITDVPYAWGIQFSGLITLGSGTPYNKGFGTATQGFITEFGVSRPKKYTFIIPNAFAYRNVDIRLRKDFANVGGNRLGLTADVFNLFNYNNFGCYNDYFGSYDANGVLTANKSYGQPGCVVADPRRLQIGMAYDFGPRFPGGAR